MHAGKANPSELRSARRFDLGAMALSVACLVHCLALPLLVAWMPLLQGRLPGEHLVHAALFLLAAPLACLALVRGFGRHRWAPVLVFGALGLMLMALDLVLGWLEFGHLLTIPGVLLLGLAHGLNLHGLHAQARRPRGASAQS